MEYGGVFVKKIFWRVLVYFGVVIFAFTILIGLLFTKLNRSNIIGAYQKQLYELAKNVATEASKAQRGGEADHFHNYLSSMETYAEAQDIDVWVVSYGKSRSPLPDDYTNVDIEKVSVPEETNKILALAYNGKKKNYYSSYDDIYKKTMLHLATPVRNSQGYVTGAVLVTGPMEMQETIITQYEKYMVICASAGLVLAIFLALYFSRQISIPIVQIKECALVMAAGKYGQRTGIHREDEIGSLAESMDILSERLIKAEKYRADVEQTRRDFFSNVSHELRTPIAVVKGYADMLADGYVPEEEKQKEYLARIRHECNGMERLVSDLLILSRMQNPEFELNLEIINVIAVAQDAMRSLRILMQERGMKGSVEYADACSLIEGDYDRIRQLFVILLQNAVKYGDEGTAIDVYVDRKEGSIVTTVRDFGSVIPEEEWEHVFEKFYRASNHGEKDGSGLGLVVADNIVRRHGGSISVRSTEEEGTCFTIIFPESSENIT